MQHHKQGVYKKKKRKIHKSGLPPGSLIFTGDKKVEDSIMTITRFNQLEYETQQTTKIDDYLSDEKIIWIDIRGLHNLELVNKVCEILNVHPLVREDIVDVHQRAKFEEYDNGFFLVIRDIEYHEHSHLAEQEQIAIFVGERFVLSFQENETDIFLKIRERIATQGGRIRKKGADYLAYALVDLVVDNYFVILEKVETRIDQLEDKITTESSFEIKIELHQLKREILKLRKAVSPLREAISRFAKTDHPYLTENTVVYVRDLYDHTIQVLDLIETYRDSISGLHDLYLSELSIRMNAVMQVLTIIATIFIPLTFLAGIYGMNFDYMPELKWKYGYFVLLAIMLAVSVGLIYFFRRKKWM